MAIDTGIGSLTGLHHTLEWSIRVALLVPPPWREICFYCRGSRV